MWHSKAVLIALVTINLTTHTGKGIFARNIFQAKLGRHLWYRLGHGSLIKVMAYILWIILPKFHCRHSLPYLVKLISVKLRSSAT